MSTENVSYLTVESENTDFQTIYVDLVEQSIITAKFDWTTKASFKITHAIIYRKKNSYNPEDIDIKNISRFTNGKYHTKIIFDFKNIPAPTNSDGSLKNPKQSIFTKKTNGNHRPDPEHIIDLERNPAFKTDEATDEENVKAGPTSVFNNHICRLYII